MGEQARVDVADQNVNNQAEVQRNRQTFIKRLAPEAKRLQQTYHVLPSITLAQAILESDWGTSQLATNYHNLFGVKGTDPNQTKVMLTKEYRNGQWVEIRGRFQIYANDQASLAAHAALLANGTSWNTNQYQHVISATNYRTAAAALKQDGYATDPDYPAKLINLIKTYDLEQYDQ
nr:glycoside hydrolase family 73 protein [Loigolactobacillus backii]